MNQSTKGKNFFLFFCRLEKFIFLCLNYFNSSWGLSVYVPKLLNSQSIMENFNKNNEIQIELSDEIAQGIYSNLAIISHSTSEFVVDFIRIVPGVPKAKVKSRIILTPEHAKRLLMALKDNIDKFEQQNGPIRIQNDPGFLPPIGGIAQA